jgi:cytochrome b
MTDAPYGAPIGVESGPGESRVRAWDPFVRAFHWSLVALVLLEVAILDDEGRAHVLAGYAVGALIALRLAWGFTGPRNARFASFPPSPGAARRHLVNLLKGRRDGPHLSHNPLGALMVYNLLATLIGIVATGIMMRMDRFWGVDWVETAHETLVDWLLLSIGLHIAGVMFESLRSGVNLVGAMVTGWKKSPERSD